MRRLIYCIAFTLSLLTSCQDKTFRFESTDGNRIEFTVQITGQTPQSQIRVKGTPQDADAYVSKKICVLGYDQTSTEYPVNFKTMISSADNGDSWSSYPTPYYDGLTYNIYSYGSDLEEITSSENGNGLWISDTSVEAPTIFYSVPNDAAKQPDLIISAKIEGQKKGKVKLNLNHALTCVGFSASSHLQGRKVKEITLRNIYGKGSFELGKDPSVHTSWKLIGNPDHTYQALVDHEAELGSNENTLTDIMQGNGYLMMLPQQLKEGAEIEVVVWDGSDPESKSVLVYPIPPTVWHPGKKYVYYFDEPPYEGVAAYYEMYEDRSVGLYYYDRGEVQDLLKTDPNNGVIDAGYGVLVPAGVWMRFPTTLLHIAIGNNGYTQSGSAYIDGSIVATVNAFGATPTDCVLYPMSQHRFPYGHTPIADQGKGITPSNTNTPQKIEAKIQGNNLKEVHGFCLPHFARGIYSTSSPIKTHYIRTPIQMRNISYQTSKDINDPLVNNSTTGNEYIQEPSTLDFTVRSNRTVFGVDVDETSQFYESIVKGAFNGTFDGTKGYASTRIKGAIGGLIIKTKTQQTYLALFDIISSGGTISDVDLNANCAITHEENGSGTGYIGGFVGYNSGQLRRLNNHASLSFTHPSTLYMGGIAGLNTDVVEACSNNGTLTNVSVSANSRVGGIVGFNEKTKAWNSLTEEYRKLMEDRVYWTQLTTEQQRNWPGAKILNCTNYGKIYGINRAGGIAAYNNYAGIIYKCENKGNVVRRISVSTEESYIGGIVGLQQTGEYAPARFNPQVIECYNRGNISDQNTTGSQKGSFGGIVGNNDWNHYPNSKIQTATAFGRIYRCINTGHVQGYGGDKSGIGGIVGINNGTVKECQASGNISGSGKTNIGGVVGFNTYYVGDCLYYNPSSYVPIVSNTLGAITGGIVGFNALASAQLDSEDKSADSGYITRCLYLAKSPQSAASGSSIGGLSPITGFTAYLYRKADGTPNLNIDGTTGATPYYTIEDSFFLSGENYNIIDATSAIYEPEVENVTLGPFLLNRYPLGVNPLATIHFETLPLMHSWQPNGWSKTTNYPFIAENPTSFTNIINPSGTGYLAHYIVNTIRSNNKSASVSIAPTGLTLNNTYRVDLLNLGSDLGALTQITIDLSLITLNSAPYNTSAGILLKAPRNWNMTLNGGGIVYGKDSELYCYIHRNNINAINRIIMTK